MSNLRIGGLASGMDLDSIVKDLMKAERIPLDKLKQDKQLLEWKQEDYREINKALFDFRDEVFDLKLQSTFNVKNATSSDENVVEVSAGANANSGVYEIAVQQLAKGAYKTSSSEIDGYTSGQSLEQQFSSVTWDGDKTGKIVINGETISFDATSDSIYEIVSKINELEDQTGVRASYDADINRFFLSTTSTGAGAKIDFTGSDTNGLKLLGNDALKIDTSTVTGQDAIFKLNGADFQMSENNFTINGITYDLKGINDSDGDGIPAVTIAVSNDTDAVLEKIKGFIDSYNETIDKIYSKLQEERYRDYLPLTEEQKEEMSEKQIELWEEKARSGLLRNDRILNGIISDMRMTMAGIVENISGKYDSLDEIGISTQNWHENGKLYIDEDKLKAALNDDPEGIKSLFTNSSEVDSEKGIAMRLYDVVVEGTELLTDKAGSESSFSLIDNSYIGKRLRDLSDEIEDWEERLIEIEDRYWREFTAMEKAINQMNAQSMWLAQQFGGM